MHRIEDAQVEPGRSLRLPDSLPAVQGFELTRFCRQKKAVGLCESEHCCLCPGIC